jgi:hypothetical protein
MPRAVSPPNRAEPDRASRLASHGMSAQCRTMPLSVSIRLLFAALALVMTSCSKHEHADHNHSGGHVHRAPHGGSLVELGAHQFNLELLHDRTLGTLTAFILDGHAENAIRIAAPAIELEVNRAGTRTTLRLGAVANPLSGETVGDTSEFAGQANWLTTTERISGEIREITVRGTTFRNVAFVLP